VSLRIILHREIPENSDLHRQWNLLALQAERPQVFYTCEWALAMQAAYQKSLRPLLFLGYEGGDLVGVASLAIDNSGRNVSFLAANTGDYCDFLTMPPARALFVDAVFGEIAKLRPRKLALANLPSDSETPAALQEAGKKHGVYVFLRPAYLCAQVQLGTSAQRKQLKSDVSRKQMLKRKLRSLESAGTVSYAHLRSWSSIQPALQAFAAAHNARFIATGRRSSLATPERRHFLEDLARRFSDSGIVTLSILLLNDQPIAWNYGFQFCGSRFWYQPTFAGTWEEHSPGFCLLARMVIEACDMEDITMIDLGLGDEGYKARFANATRQTLHATVTKSWSSHLREIARYRAASALKRSPKVDSAVRRVLGR
jgi:CelD/BcsL family acetyltransferase involved in cellulose biosynthesis